MGKTLKALILLLFICVNIGMSQSFVVCKTGTLPILLSAPHGGNLKPSKIPNRDCNRCKVEEDTYTKEIMLGVNTELNKLFGTSIYYVYSNLHRSKLDFNRPVLEATDSNKTLVPIWNTYHNFIKKFSLKHDRALVIDFHGHTHKEELLEIGSFNEFTKVAFGNLFNVYFDSKASYPANNTARPKLYFSGGYITKTVYNRETHLQLELPKSMRFENRTKTIKSIAKTIYTYYNLNFK
jgi:N-formylglutamate amidohydrolase